MVWWCWYWWRGVHATCDSVPIFVVLVVVGGVVLETGVVVVVAVVLVVAVRAVEVEVVVEMVVEVAAL